MGRVSFSGLVPDFITENTEAYKVWLVTIAGKRAFKVLQLSYYFVDREEIRVLNRKLLDHDYATDIITVNHSRGNRLKIEFYLGGPLIEDNARDLNLSRVEEYSRVMVHGMLHCMGWDDLTVEDRKAMRKEEEICLISRPVFKGK